MKKLLKQVPEAMISWPFTQIMPLKDAVDHMIHFCFIHTTVSEYLSKQGIFALSGLGGVLDFRTATEKFSFFLHYIQA